MRYGIVLCLIIALVLLFNTDTKAEKEDIEYFKDMIEIVKLTGVEKRAVIRLKPSGKLQVVNIDDTIEHFGKIIDIVSTRIIIKNKESELIFVQLQDDITTIQRISNKAHSDIYKTILQTQNTFSQDENGSAASFVTDSEKSKKQ